MLLILSYMKLKEFLTSLISDIIDISIIDAGKRDLICRKTIFLHRIEF